MAEKIEMFNNRNANAVLDDLKETLDIMADEWGLKVDVAKSKGTATEMTAVISLKLANTDIAAQVLGPQFKALGLPENSLGRSFSSMGTVFRITGINHRRPKFPISGERLYDKAPFKFPVGQILRGTWVD